MNHPSSTTEKAQAPSHFLRNFILIFLSALLLLGAVLTAVSLARDTKTYARYSGTIADRATYSYLLSYYKFNHMRALAGVSGAEDTESFWLSTDAESGKTQGELLIEGAKEYVARVLISASLFDAGASAAQKSAAKESAKRAAEEILTYRAEGDKDAFDALAAEFGYSFADLESIALLLYKAENAQALYYGISGETAGTRLTECNLYLKENYTAARLLFIRTETTFSTTKDEDGNLNVDMDDDGAYVIRPLLEAEIEKRAQIMEMLDTEIASGSFRKAIFDGIASEHYASYPEGTDTVYYFADGSAYTESFKKSLGDDIVSTAKSLSVGECAKVAYADGYCYVYKCEVADNAFGEESSKSFFSDFYENVATHLFSEDVAVFADDVVFKNRASEISVLTVPYKNLIRVRF